MHNILVPLQSLSLNFFVANCCTFCRYVIFSPCGCSACGDGDVFPANTLEMLGSDTGMHNDVGLRISVFRRMTVEMKSV